MTIKFRLVSAIITFLLVLSLLLCGVWAAKTATVNIGGTVSFVAKDVYCQVDGRYVNAVEMENPETLLWDSNYGDAPTEEAKNTWVGRTLKFDEEATDIHLNIDFQNLSTEVGLDVKLTKTLDFEGIDVTYALDGEEYILGTVVDLQPKKSCRFVITFSVQDDEYSVSQQAYGYLFNIDSQVV